MKTLIRVVLSGTILVAVLGIVLLLLLRGPAQPQDTAIAITDAEPVDIREVTVDNEHGSYRFYYEGDGYVLDDVPGTIADLDAFIAFMTGCARLRAVRGIEAGDEDLAAYGLEHPAATAAIAFFDGDEVRLSVGAEEPVSRDYYAKVEGHDGVLVLPRAQALPLLAPKKQIIAMQVTPALAFSSPLSAIRDVTFSGGPLQQPVTIQATAGADDAVRKAAMAFGAATHIVRGAGVYQLDQTYGVEMLGALFALPAVDIAGYNLTEAEVADYGFDDPFMTVEYDLVTADGGLQHCVLRLVRIDDSLFYAALEGTGAVYIVGRPAFADLVYDKLLLRWVLSPLLMDISAITVESPDGVAELVVDNTDPREPDVTLDGRPVDVEQFRAFYRLITSAAHDGAFLGELEKPQGEALLRITYAYADPDKADDVLELFPGETRRANVFVNGAGEFAMKDLFATRVREGVQRLLTEEPIEENWQ